MKKTILIADDHSGIVDVLSAYALKEGYHPIKALDGVDALAKFNLETPQVVLLDVMMPGMDGFEVCREIRKTSSVPIIMITARSEDVDVIMGLDLGADDYIIKPFTPAAVMARIRAVLRRVEGSEEVQAQVVTLPGLTLNLSEHRATFENQPLALTRKEIDLLWLFATNPNHVFSREHLLNAIWGYDYYGDSRTVDTHIKRLRAKIDQLRAVGTPPIWDIRTIWGVGYKLEVTHEALGHQ